MAIAITRRALKHFEIAKRGLPNEAEAYMAIGAIQRRQGKWKESTANLEKAAELDPKNASVLSNLGANYLAQRNFDAADKTFDRAIVASPQSFSAHGFKGGRRRSFGGATRLWPRSQLALVPPAETWMEASPPLEFGF